ncbi:4203_t:CDS:2 [Dentiscutata erythropus]|uniref:Protein transport protein sec16 n=1 Tax=Dentiscutata erythropus TaxID=1348616 RepID=A0A9N9G875_9GLOM|nr:4203_t:CDS:2 [Dentiscutata erythropus]
MEGSTVHTTQSTSEENVKTAGSASSLFSDSIQSPFDSLFSPTNDSNSTGQDYWQYYYSQQYQYDPSQQFDPSQQYQYDPNQQYDPSTYDSSSGYYYNNQNYDPNYDPNQAYAPNDATHDPNQTYIFNDAAYDPNQTYASNGAASAYGPNQGYDYSQYYNESNNEANDLNSAKVDNDIAAVTSVETIETNQEHKLSSVASNEGEMNNLEEEQEVNIVHRNNDDIFEYQPQDLEGPQKAELSQVDQPTSQIADNSQISAELVVSREPEEITDLTNKDTGKLDDLDDLVLGHTTSETSREVSTIELETNQATNDPALTYHYGSTEQVSYNYEYEGYLAETYTQYDNNIVGNNTNNFNYPYTGHNVSQPTIDGISGIHQSTHQYSNYDSNQPTVVNTPPPQSYSPFSAKVVVQFVPCLYPQCTGENKPSAKFCSECGRIINESSPSPIVDTPNLYQNSAVQQQYGTDNTNIVNDPLGRSKGCPIVAFGFGGKVFTMFPRTVQRFTSTDQSIPITKYTPGAFIIRTLKDIIPSSDLEDFPGPLLMDNNRGGIKAKRKHVIKYLDDQIKVAEDVLNSFAGEEVEKKNSEANTIIWHLLKIMFEHDGVLTGSPKVEEAVRHVLAPSTTKTKQDDESNFTVPADSNFDSTPSLPESSTPQSMTYSITPKTIDTLQELLLKGDRVAAINHAVNNNLWAHALIIASCVNKDQWKEVVNDFIRHELGSQLNDASQSNGRECLRVLYSLFAGNGPINQFLPHSTLLNRVTQPSPTTIFPLVPPTTNAAQLNTSANLQYSPATMNPLYSSATCDIPIESLEKWRETLAIILANRSPGDNQAISALGDMLKEFGWINAAHVCYILSPQSSTQSGIDDVNSRFTLVSNDYICNQSSRFFCDWKALRLTEIYELGLSLNNNDGLPFLQAYKLLYAWWLVDCGYLNEARRQENDYYQY